jgi:hypothetical protein
MARGGKRAGSGRKRSDVAVRHLVAWRAPSRLIEICEAHRSSNSHYVRWRPPPLSSQIRKAIRIATKTTTKWKSKRYRLPKKLGAEGSKMLVLRIDKSTSDLLNETTKSNDITRSELLNRIFWNKAKKICLGFYQPGKQHLMNWDP